MKPFEFRPGKGRSADHLKAVVSDYLSAAKLNGLHRFRDLYPGIKELAEKRGVTVWENGASTALKTLGHKRIISGNVVHYEIKTQRQPQGTTESRDADILRTTEAPHFVQVLVWAKASDMSSNAFRQLFTFLTYADPDGTNAFPSHETVAAITGCSVSTSKRATNELTKLGWISTQRKRRGPAVRTVKIPEENVTAVEGEILEVSHVTLQSDSSKFLKSHPCTSRRVSRRRAA
jgi:hypothetical protein